MPIALADTLDFELRSDGRIVRSGDVIGPPENDLCVRAATLLQRESGTSLGVDLAVDLEADPTPADVQPEVAAGLGPVKLNVVVVRGLNDAEVPDFVALTERREVVSQTRPPDNA